MLLQTLIVSFQGRLLKQKKVCYFLSHCHCVNTELRERSAKVNWATLHQSPVLNSIYPESDNDQQLTSDADISSILLCRGLCHFCHHLLYACVYRAGIQIKSQVFHKLNACQQPGILKESAHVIWIDFFDHRYKCKYP